MVIILLSVPLIFPLSGTYVLTGAHDMELTALAAYGDVLLTCGCVSTLFSGRYCRHLRSKCSGHTSTTNRRILLLAVLLLLNYGLIVVDRILLHLTVPGGGELLGLQSLLPIVVAMCLYVNGNILYLHPPSPGSTPVSLIL